MQTLNVAPRLFPDILTGVKRSTIRWREARIAPGFMRYVNVADRDATVIVLVTRCTDMPLSRAASFLSREGEWPKETMLAGMREHYPGIGWDDTVQIVEHLSPDETAARPDFPG